MILWIIVKTEDLSRDGSYSLSSGCEARCSFCPRIVERVNYRTAPLFGRQNHILMNTGTMTTTVTNHHLLKNTNFLSVVFLPTEYICKSWHVFVIPGHCTVLHGSCSSLSPLQGNVEFLWPNLWLQIRNRRRNPTSLTWLKQVLVHSDQLVHLLQTPSAKTEQKRNEVINIY